MATRKHVKLPRKAAKPAAKSRPKQLELWESYQLLVDCRDEKDQRSLYERLAAEGYSCRVLTV